MSEQILHLGQYSEELETLTRLLKQRIFLAQFAWYLTGVSHISQVVQCCGCCEDEDVRDASRCASSEIGQNAKLDRRR